MVCLQLSFTAPRSEAAPSPRVTINPVMLSPNFSAMPGPRHVGGSVGHERLAGGATGACRAIERRNQYFAKNRAVRLNCPAEIPDAKNPGLVRRSLADRRSLPG